VAAARHYRISRLNLSRPVAARISTGMRRQTQSHPARRQPAYPLRPAVQLGSSILIRQPANVGRVLPRHSAGGLDILVLRYQGIAFRRDSLTRRRVDGRRSRAKVVVLRAQAHEQWIALKVAAEYRAALGAESAAAVKMLSYASTETVSPYDIQERTSRMLVNEPVAGY
jgi:hypothetical protein